MRKQRIKGSVAVVLALSFAQSSAPSSAVSVDTELPVSLHLTRA